MSKIRNKLKTKICKKNKNMKGKKKKTKQTSKKVFIQMGTLCAHAYYSLCSAITKNKIVFVLLFCRSYAFVYKDRTQQINPSP